MFRGMMAALAAVVLATPVCALNVNWADWTGVSTGRNGTTVTGVMDVNGTAVTVTYTNLAGISFAQTAGGTDYWQNRGGGRNPATSPYTSTGANGVDNIPTGTDIVGLRYQGQQMLTFSQAVSNVYFAFVSLNGNGYAFDNQDFTILSGGNQNFDGNGTDDCGFWGCGTSTKSVSGSTYSLLGTGEPHGTLLLSGSFRTVTWTSLSDENWNGFTVGVKGLTPPSIPLPATGLLLMTGLVGAAALKRRKLRG